MSLLLVSFIANITSFAQTSKAKIKPTKPATSFTEVSGLDLETKAVK